jgi:hypothetical protein
MSQPGNYSNSQQAYSVAVGTAPTGSAIISQRNPTTADIKYKIGQFWINTAAENLWYLNNQSSSGGQLLSNWIEISEISATGILTVTANSGGAVGPTLGNVNIVGDGTTITIAGNAGTSTLTASLAGSVATTYDADSGSATPSGGTLTIAGGTGVSTSGSGSTITISASSAVATTYGTDSGNAVPSGNFLKVSGGTGIATSGSGDTITITLSTPVSVAHGGTGDTSFTAYSVITGGTTSTGALQNVSGVGTLDQVLCSNGAGALPSWKTIAATGAFDVLNVQVFTTSGTYTPTSGMVYCIAECIGGGAGGSGASGDGNYSYGGGGGGGGYARAYLSASDVGASQTVTIGAGGLAGSNAGGGGGGGGTTSLGSLCAATGGAAVGGSVGAFGFAFAVSVGGLGGIGTIGDVLVAGQAGTQATFSAVNAFGNSGGGGSSVLGGGAVGIFSWTSAPANSTGNAGRTYGGGGSGAVNTATSFGQVGGVGYAGVCIVTEFISS